MTAFTHKNSDFSTKPASPWRPNAARRPLFVRLPPAAPQTGSALQSGGAYNAALPPRKVFPLDFSD
jgi:hypothetical protein